LVRHEGPVGPWILASEAVLQEGCTTAVEAYLADIPVITFESISDPTSEQKIPKTIGIRCSTPSQVCEAVDDVLAGQKGVVHRLGTQSRNLFANFDSNTVQPVLDTIDEAEQRLPKGGHSPSPADLLPGETMRVLKSKLSNAVRPLFPDKQRRFLSLQQRFPGFKQDEINRKITTIQQMLDRSVEYTFVNKWLIIAEK